MRRATLYCATRMTATWEVLDSVEALGPAVAGWDRLAVASGAPYCAPGWLLAWWRHAAPPDARLRVVVVRDGPRVVGVAPFYAKPWRAGLWRWSLLATDVSSRIEPLSDPVHRPRVAHAVTAALAEGDPRPARIELNGLPAGSYWPRALRSGWPGRRPWHHRADPTPAPTVPLAAAGLDEWLGTRSSNFRQQMRRARRRFEKDGGAFRITRTVADLERDLPLFERLHEARWDHRGGSAALVAGIDRMLADAGAELIGGGRFLLVSMEVGGQVVNSQLFLAAGTEMSYWNGGFDDSSAFAPYKPAMSGLVEAVRLGLERGYERLDLGPGAQDYKYRFSDAQDELVWQTLIPPGRRSPLAHALFGPTRARSVAARRLSDEQKARVKLLLRRG